ncbi:MAG TPA: CDGSH iron-sulfur domain-containing protein [bacterium]|nr:CDGSH iron-sulfur domain-containing protein [bacterium]HPN42871.1 CDGSH iron-sulfur domain-containing protein [bacterium]
MAEEKITEIKVQDHKSYAITGKIKIIKPDGSEEIKEGTTYLCRCGASGNKPFCDGSHKKIGF